MKDSRCCSLGRTQDNYVITNPLERNLPSGLERTYLVWGIIPLPTSNPHDTVDAEKKNKRGLGPWLEPFKSKSIYCLWWDCLPDWAVAPAMAPHVSFHVTRRSLSTSSWSLLSSFSRTWDITLPRAREREKTCLSFTDVHNMRSLADHVNDVSVY